jgi:hypothetical protein
MGRHSDINMVRAGRIVSYLCRPFYEDLDAPDLARMIGVRDYDVHRAKKAFKWGYTVKIALNQIRLDGGIQPRAELSPQVIDEYAAQMKEGATAFPPVVVYYDGQDYWLTEGFHRVHAAIRAGFKKIGAEVKQGDRRDAMLFAVGSNAFHGLRRTQADKRRVVLRLLEDEEWSRKLSDGEIARRCCVHQTFVSQLRRQLFPPTQDNLSSEKRKGRDGKLRDTSKVGRKKEVAETNGFHQPESSSVFSDPSVAAFDESESEPESESIVEDPWSERAEESDREADMDVQEPESEDVTVRTNGQPTRNVATVRHTCPTCGGRGYIEGNQ